MLIRSLARRTAVVATGGALVASGLLVAGPAPQAHAADPVAQNAGLNWLVKHIGSDNLVDGNVTSTIEYVLSAQALGAMPDGRVKAGVDAALPAYVGLGGQNIAMAAIFYEALGLDPTATPAGNLITKLEAEIDDTTGELTTAKYTYAQALAVRALENDASSTEADAAYDFLVNHQRCADGGFNWGETTDPVGGCSSSVDETSLAIVALDGVSGAETVVADAATWLVSQQRDGAFGYNRWTAPFDFVASANSTGLATQALLLAGKTDAAARGGIWVRRHQTLGSACDGKLATERGAIPSDVSYIVDGRTDGIDNTTRGSWVLATAQGVRALAAAPAPTVPAVTAPVFVHAPGTVTVRTTGLAAGVNGCVTLAGKAVAVQGGATTTASVALPAGTRTHTATLTYLGGTKSVAIKALGATKLGVKSAARAKARTKLKVKVSGLVAGERVTVKIGTAKAVGTANAAGKATLKVKLAKKRGKTKIVVTGQFADRKGKAPLRIV